MGVVGAFSGAQMLGAMLLMQGAIGTAVAGVYAVTHPKEVKDYITTTFNKLQGPAVTLPDCSAGETTTRMEHKGKAYIVSCP